MSTTAPSLLFAHGLFSCIFGIGTALAMILAARYLGEGLNDFLLRLIGHSSLLSDARRRG